MYDMLAVCVDWGLSWFTLFACAVVLWLAGGFAGCAADPCGANLREVLMIGENTLTVERMTEVRDKYLPLLERYPNYVGSGVGRFRDENGELTGGRGIVISVLEEVDPSTLPPEDRIPDCLEGIPVQLEVSGPFELIPLEVGA